MNSLITTLFLIAALCLLPAWFVGLAALGAAVGLFVYNGLSENGRRHKAEEASEDEPRRFTAGERPGKIIHLKDHRR